MLFGYLRDAKDERDWQWPTLMGLAPTTLPERISLESAIGPVFDQGQTSECVCFSCAGIKRYHEFEQSGAWLSFDPDELYRQCKAVDGAPGSDGTFPRVALDQLVKVGMLASDGKRYTIAGYARLTSIDQIKHAISEKKPVLIGVRVDIEAIAKLTPGSTLPMADHFDGGHCMVIVGYDDALKAFRIRNSWSEAWSDHGHFWMPYDYLTTCDPEFDCWSSVDFTSEDPR
jgi:C1A family cysteine protease